MDEFPCCRRLRTAAALAAEHTPSDLVILTLVPPIGAGTTVYWTPDSGTRESAERACDVARRLQDARRSPLFVLRFFSQPVNDQLLRVFLYAWDLYDTLEDDVVGQLKERFTRMFTEQKGEPAI